MPEETLRFNVELDVPRLQGQLDMARMGVGQGIQGAFSAAGAGFAVGGSAFNTATADLSAARQTFAMSVPSFPSLPFGFHGGVPQFIDPAAQTGFFGGLAMRAGLIPPPPSALLSDVTSLQQIQFTETMARAGAGFGLRFAMPAAVGITTAALTGFAFGGPVGMGMGIAAGLGADLVGGGAYDQFVNRRERTLLLRATGMDEGFAGEFAGAMGTFNTESRFVGLDDENVTGFMAQQAFARRLPREGGPQASKKSIDQFREDLRSVTEIQATLNLAFDDAADMMAQLQGMGMVSQNVAQAAGGAGTVRGFLSQVRAMGAAGFTPNQQRAAALGAIQFGGQIRAAGGDPDIALQAAGIQGRFAAGLFREAGQGTEFQRELARRTGTVGGMRAAVAGGMEGVARQSIVQSALLSALLEDPDDIPGALDRAGELMKQGPTAIYAASTAALEAPGIHRVSRMAHARQLVGVAQGLMIQDPTLGAGLTAGTIGFMRKTAPGLLPEDPAQLAPILAELLQVSLEQAKTLAMIEQRQRQGKGLGGIVDETAVTDAEKQIRDTGVATERSLWNVTRAFFGGVGEKVWEAVAPFGPGRMAGNIGEYGRRAVDTMSSMKFMIVPDLLRGVKAERKAGMFRERYDQLRSENVSESDAIEQAREFAERHTFTGSELESIDAEADRRYYDEVEGVHTVLGRRPTQYEDPLSRRLGLPGAGGGMDMSHYEFVGKRPMGETTSRATSRAFFSALEAARVELVREGSLQEDADLQRQLLPLLIKKLSAVPGGSGAEMIHPEEVGRYPKEARDLIASIKALTDLLRKQNAAGRN